MYHGEAIKHMTMLEYCSRSYLVAVTSQQAHRATRQQIMLIHVRDRVLQGNRHVAYGDTKRLSV